MFLPEMFFGGGGRNVYPEIFFGGGGRNISPRNMSRHFLRKKKKMKKGKDKKSAPPLSPPGNVHPCRGAPTPRSTDGSAARPPLPLVYIYYIVQTGFQPAAAPAASPSADSIVFGEILPRRGNSRPRSGLGSTGSGAEAGPRAPARQEPGAGSRELCVIKVWSVRCTKRRL